MPLSFLLIITIFLTGVALPETYRFDRYRAATPETVPGATAINTQELQQLLAQETVILIDVMAAIYRPEMLDFGGEWLLQESRYHLPNSIWLPNVGYGELNPLMQSYLTDNLQQLTHGEKNKPIVFYCILDCWMAWNVSKRAALELGYEQVYWYRDGIEGWIDAGLPTVLAHPVPLKINSSHQ
ncbi:rhodanese-like domain-containing protein [Thioflexithrix psekupsensis]|uniref:Rhodanese domain-containing protein n=1 Tax=Thioflexithrix psekupsensis TaxID=1570016 RepID=A0A251X7W7_9GAMM|nr:rhodanese-like domain-containing protein [Thioflexithrix psekupsensis]OUD14030.1 hypothetical protein TPSD3_06735 [Thioflexithrix psekupsensis]